MFVIILCVSNTEVGHIFNPSFAGLPILILQKKKKNPKKSGFGRKKKNNPSYSM